ncbi:antibiotic biosynthesis monooxygenase [Gordonia oryzae]|uniref:Antibiotic biosynthesis monooxygenase n=1 Tax=Gordonia oryzae TaxID=2487349 RepID=A0A3N4G8S5_9ACTN|nr:putative quinol monooxygenase [Gordonia oryzae]RPA58478.1 antibiotic biosynthesis monooxygenase [Gordonia oryzae]
MSAVIVVATIAPQPGTEEEVRAAILTAIDKVHKEPGCELYALHKSATGNEFVMIEKWESADALKVHGGAPALTELAGAIGGLLAGPLEVKTFTAVLAGDPDKGAL